MQGTISILSFPENMSPNRRRPQLNYLWVKVADKRATTNLKYYFEVFFIPKKCLFEIFLLWMKSYFEVFLALIKMLFRDILPVTPIEKMEVNDWGAQNFPGPRQSSPTSQSTQIISNQCHSQQQNCYRKYHLFTLQQIVANWTNLWHNLTHFVRLWYTVIHCETLQANPPKSLQIIVTQRDSNVAATQIPNCPRTGNTIRDDEWKYDLWNNRNPNDCRRMIKGAAPQIQMVMPRKCDFCLGGNWEAAPYRNPGSGFAPRDLTFIGISRTEYGNVIVGGKYGPEKYIQLK